MRGSGPGEVQGEEERTYLLGQRETSFCCNSKIALQRKKEEYTHKQPKPKTFQQLQSCRETERRKDGHPAGQTDSKTAKRKEEKSRQPFKNKNKKQSKKQARDTPQAYIKTKKNQTKQTKQTKQNPINGHSSCTTAWKWSSSDDWTLQPNRRAA